MTREEIEKAVNEIKAEYGVHPRELGAFNTVAGRLDRGDKAGAIERLKELIHNAEKRNEGYRAILERILGGE